jgi:hypothetical protein
MAKFGGMDVADAKRPKAFEENGSLKKRLAEARMILAAWRLDCGTAKPHSRLGWLTPSEFARTATPVQVMAKGAA